MATKTQSTDSFDWRERYAYSLGVQAYLYGLPWAYMPEVRWARVVGAPGHEGETAPANTFRHFHELVNAKTSQGGGPNNDTLYSRAWIDVGPEPIILSLPEIRDRYHTFQISGFDSDNFASVGLRDDPGSEKSSNWLPAPDGSFVMALRTYLPDYAIIEQYWQPPALQTVPEQ